MTSGGAPPVRWTKAPQASTIAVVGAVGVAGVLLAVVFLGGFSGSGGGNGLGSGTTFDQARALGGAAASAHGSWNLWFVEGVALARAAILPLNLSADPNCTVTSFSGALPTEVTFPAFQGNFASGQANVWLLEYLSTGLDADLLVIVLDGSVSLVVEESGANCLNTGSATFTPIPSGVVDSPVAVAAVAAAGGTAFLAANPGRTSVDMTLLGSVTFGSTTEPIEWGVDFSTCPLLVANTTASGTSFFANVNATTGLVVPGSAGNSTCGLPSSSPPPAIGQALTFLPVPTVTGAGTGGTIGSQGCASGTTCFELSVVTAVNVTPADIDSAMVWSSNHSVYSVEGFAVLNLAGHVLVYSVGPTEGGWSPGVGNGSTPFASGMTLVIDVGPTPVSPENFTLQVTGEGPYANSELWQSLG